MQSGKLVTLGAAALALLLGVAVHPARVEGAAYYNVVNKPFATVSNGPQNAVIISDSGGTVVIKPQAMGMQQGRSQTVSPYSRQIEFLRKAGLLGAGQEVEIDQTVIHSHGGRLAIPSTVTRSPGVISFVVDSATWSAADGQLLERFIGIAYPSVAQVYGAPGQTATVRVVQDNTLIDRDWFTGGLYDLSSNTIRLPRYNSNKSLERGLLHLMVHAFHGPARFSYDAWEEGFARAASVVVGEAVDSQLASAGLETLDFVTAGGDAFYYLMPVYDLLNQPALGNSIFLTTWTESITDGSARFGGMLIPRLGMSSTAWLKVYVEALRKSSTQFFAAFNSAYYAQWQPNHSIAGNVPTLKGIATSIVSQVEGLPFDDWYRRQYVLDTSVTIGKKLYAYVVPITPEETAPENYTAYVFLMHYITSRAADEQPISGYCYPVYWNYLYDQDIYLGGQYEEIFVSDGEGYLAPTFTVGNVGGTQRVAMDFTLNDLTQRVYLPVGLIGTAASQSSVYGVVAGASTGSLSVQVDADPSITLPVDRGGFATADTSASAGWSVVQLSFTGDTTSASRTVNKGLGNCAVILDALDSVRALQTSFGAGWHMMSVPGTPLATDQAEALGVSPTGLLLARWQPDDPASYKYKMYPAAPPFRTGEGFWLRTGANLTPSVTMRIEDQAAPWRVGLMPGWNQIGCPFISPVAVEDLQVETGNEDPITYNDGMATGIVGPIFGYDPGGFYVFPTALEPWKAYWIRCYRPGGAVVTVPGPEAP